MTKHLIKSILLTSNLILIIFLFLTQLNLNHNFILFFKSLFCLLFVRKMMKTYKTK